MSVIEHELAFAMYAQQRFGGLGDDVDLNRARLFWQAEDAEQQAMWRSKARGVLRACNLQGAVGTLAEVRLYAEKMLRSGDGNTRIQGADLLGIIDHDAGGQ